MASSLLAGVSGLRAHQQLLDVVGNNLANINTIGYKAQRLRFADLLSETKKPATGSVAGLLGGTNPVQVGLGVKTAAIDTDLKQGSLEATGNDLDLAILGDGYFIVNDGTLDLYTRAGAFGTDANHTLVDLATGARVQRYGTVGEGNATTPAFQVPGDASIQIPFGTSIPGQATSQVTIKGNLSASSAGPLAETFTSAQPFEEGGVAATGATLLTDLDTNGVDYVDGDVIAITGTDVDGTAVNDTLVIDADATTLDDLLAAINAAFSGATSPRSTNPGNDPIASARNVVPERGEPTTKTKRSSSLPNRALKEAPRRGARRFATRRWRAADWTMPGTGAVTGAPSGAAISIPLWGWRGWLLKKRRSPNSLLSRPWAGSAKRSGGSATSVQLPKARATAT